MFVKEFFAFLSGIEVMSAMWLGVESYKTRRPDKTKQESLASPLVQACLVGILYTAPFAIMLAFFPSAFGPNGKAHFFSKTSLHDGSLDALEIFTIRLEGLHLLCYCTAGIEGFQVLPVSLNRFTMIAFILFAYVFAVASRDETGYLNKKTYEASLLLHLLVCGGMWKLQTSRKAKTVTKKSQ